MSVVFCTSCGHRMEFAGAKPNFCSSCGFNFREETIAAKPVARKTIDAKNGTSVGSDETDYEYVPSIAKLEYECDFGGPHKMHTLADLLNESTEEKKSKPKEIKRARRPSKD